MLKKLKQSNSGFTIIEVLIVLAIGALILLIVFLAVPALQRNSRNTRRTNDVSKLAGLVNEYVANHGGTLPDAVSSTGLDLSTEKWAIINAPASGDIVSNTTWGTTATVKINKGYICDTTTNTLTAGSTRAFSITYKTETGGADQNVCITG